MALCQYPQDDLGETIKHRRCWDRAQVMSLKHITWQALLRLEGDFAKAEKQFEKAINLKPECSHALYNMAYDVYLQDIVSARGFYQYYLAAPEGTDIKNCVECLRRSLEC